jgi:hypothetical protein
MCNNHSNPATKPGNSTKEGRIERTSPKLQSQWKSTPNRPSWLKQTINSLPSIAALLEQNCCRSRRRMQPCVANFSCKEGDVQSHTSERRRSGEQHARGGVTSVVELVSCHSHHPSNRYPSRSAKPRTPQTRALPPSLQCSRLRCPRVPPSSAPRRRLQQRRAPCWVARPSLAGSHGDCRPSSAPRARARPASPTKSSTTSRVRVRASAQ